MVLVLVLLTLNHQDRKESGGQAQPPREDVSIATMDSTIRLELPFYTSEKKQVIASEAVRVYMESDIASTVVDDVISKHWSANSRSDTSVPIELSYVVSGLPKGEKIASAVFQVSETDDFTDAPTLQPQKGAKSVLVYNLKRDTQYQYRVILTTESGTRVIAQSSFWTADNPRMLFVDGVYNVRDIGGWKTTSGKTVQQGLLYRGSELDGRVESKYSVTSAGMTTMQDTLKIQTEMDLRGSGYQGSLGVQVQYFSCDVAEYDVCFRSEYNEEIRKLFAELAKPENYPVYLHCTYGMDRTGTVCFLLEAMLGLSEEDLTREYELSAICHGGIDEAQFDKLMVELKKQSGNNLMEKAESYLLSVGVTQAEIDSIRAIFLNL